MDMGEATGAIGKFLISVIAAALIGASMYGSLKTFGLESFLGFPYAVEIVSGLAFLFSLILVYGLMMGLKRHL